MLTHSLSTLSIEIHANLTIQDVFIFWITSVPASNSSQAKFGKRKIVNMDSICSQHQSLRPKK